MKTRLLTILTLCTLFLGCSIPQEKIEQYQKRVTEQKKALKKAQDKRIIKELELHLIEAVLVLRTKELEYSLSPSEKTMGSFQKATITLYENYDSLQNYCRLSSREDMIDPLKEFLNSTSAYDKAFFEFAESKRDLGLDKSSGAMYKLRQGAHQLMQIISKNKTLQDNYQLRCLILEIRRYEKDFLLYGEAKSVTKANKKLEELSSLLSKIDPSGASDYTKTISAYKNGLSLYESTIQRVEQKQKSLKDRYSALQRALEKLKGTLNP